MTTCIYHIRLSDSPPRPDEDLAYSPSAMMSAVTNTLTLRSLSARVWSEPELGVAGSEGVRPAVTLAWRQVHRAGRWGRREWGGHPGWRDLRGQVHGGVGRARLSARVCIKVTGDARHARESMARCLQCQAGLRPGGTREPWRGCERRRGWGQGWGRGRDQVFFISQRFYWIKWDASLAAPSSRLWDNVSMPGTLHSSSHLPLTTEVLL